MAKKRRRTAEGAKGGPDAGADQRTGTGSETGTQTDAETGSEAWRSRRMVGGRWRDPSAAAFKPRVDKVISIKLTEAELAEFDAQIAAVGLKRNRALRIAARRIGGFLEMDPEALTELRGVARQIGGIARNINQLARVAHVTQSVDYERLMIQRQHLGEEFATLDALMQRLLNVGQRRTDGLRRLERSRAE